MNGKKAKLLRKGAKRYRLPYEKLKIAYNNLSTLGKESFAETIRGGVKL
jgi:hypothetical protein